MKTNYRAVFKKNPLFGNCPNCNTANMLRRSHAKNFKESVIKGITPFKLYRCKNCGWRGYISTFSFNMRSIKLIISYIVLASVTGLVVYKILQSFVK